MKVVRCAYPTPAQPLLLNVTNKFDVFKHLSIRLPNLAAVGHFKETWRVWATPLIPGRKKDTPANFDTVLIRSESELELGNQVTRGTCKGLVVRQTSSSLVLTDVISSFRTLSGPDAHDSRTA